MNKILILALLVGCGKYKTTSSRLGQIRSFAPQALSSDESARLSLICSSLDAKYASITASPSLTYTFSVASKSCEDAKLSVSRLAMVTIDNQSSSYVKFKEGSATFVFPDVETRNSGIMKEICANLSTGTDSFRSDAGNAVWYTSSGVSSSDCNPGNGEMCLLIDTGTPSGASFKVSNKDWVKFQVDSALPHYGFFVDRRVESDSVCGQNKYTVNVATLR